MKNLTVLQAATIDADNHHFYVEFTSQLINTNPCALWTMAALRFTRTYGPCLFSNRDHSDDMGTGTISFRTLNKKNLSMWVEESMERKE